MTDILPPAGWPNVRQLETNEFASGGANGNMNEQAKSLAARSELLKQYTALPYESKTSGYALNERVQLATGDIVKSTIPNNTANPNVDMTGWYNFAGEQDVINDATIQKVASIADLIEYKPRKNSQVVNVLSCHPDKNVGGDLFMWRSDLSKSLHDGGYVIDPLIAMPSLATFNTYYSPKNTGTGVWVRLNNKQDVHAEAYGIVKLTDDPTAVWSCAAIQQAIKKASVNSTTDYFTRTVKVGRGKYATTNPVILSQNGNFPARLPALIGGNGKSVYEVELFKTTQNTVGEGYYGGNIDAVLFVAAKTTGSQYVYGENTAGFTFTRTALDVGYGYFAQNSVMGYRGDIQSIGHAQNFWTNDCWMSKLGFIRSYQGLKGIAIRGGTSTFGGPLYVDMAKQHGYDFYGLSYSDLNCACDGVGAELENGGIAYDLSYCRAVSGTFAVERHKGIEFYLNNTDGGSAKGRSYHSAAVPALTYKVWVQAGSTFSFTGYNWKESLVNLTQAEQANYRLTNKVKYQGTSSVDYINCEFAPEFARDGFAGQLDSRYAGNVTDASYVDNAGVITHTMAISNTVFKRLCYLGQSSAVELLSANATNPTYGDRFYCNAFKLTEGTPNTIANPKPNRIAKSAISTNSASPTILWYLSQSGAITVAHLRGYIDADGWLCVQHNVAGNGIDYRFVLAV